MLLSTLLQHNSIFQQIITTAFISQHICKLGENYLKEYHCDAISKQRQYTDSMLQLFKTAIKLGNGEANSNLGQMYLYGIGVNKSKERAYQLLIKAKLAGSLNASLHLGKICLSKQNYEEAQQYFAAASKLPAAAYELGKMYLSSCGVSTDYIKSKEFFKTSAKQGYQPAIEALLNNNFSAHKRHKLKMQS